MRSYVWSQVVHRGSRLLSLAAGVLVAAVAATLLTASVQVSDVQTRGAVDRSFRAAYDLLVRPPGATTKLERSAGLVSANFQSGIFGGITLEQWQRIKALPGVSVAAPVANVGYVLTIQQAQVPVAQLGRLRPSHLYRISYHHRAQRGLSTYPGVRQYVLAVRRPGDCDDRYVNAPNNESPYEANGPQHAFSSCIVVDVRGRPVTPGETVTADAQFPLLVAAVDPVEENKLVGLDSAIVPGAGGPLRSGDTWAENRFGGAEVPVIVSNRTYVDETLLLDVRDLRLPDGVSALDVMGGLDGVRPDRSNAAYRRTAMLRGVVQARTILPTRKLWRSTLDQLDEGGFFESYWTLGQVEYARGGAGRLTAQASRRPTQKTWRLATGGYAPVPASTRDVWFRSIRTHPHTVNAMNVGATTLKVLGQFDPQQLPGFDPLSEVPLESYYPPVATAGDPASRRALGGRALAPTSSPGDYLSSPPLLLTTLAGAQGFLDPRFTTSGASRAPISVIRIRVAGVSGPDKLSLARIRQAATAIHDSTGLRVDVTAGSSTTPVLVHLPAGLDGRPALVLREQWTRKGVAVVLLTALDRKSAVLLALALLVTLAFLSNAATAMVASRRSEIGVLACLGWGPRRIFVSLVAELALVALVAGSLGVVAAVVISRLTGLDQAPWLPLAVVPVSFTLVALSAIRPCLRATRATPMDAVLPAGRPTLRFRWHRPARTLPSVAWRNVMRAPARSALVAVALAIATASVGILLVVQLAFRGAVTGTALGNVVSLQVRGADVVAAMLILGLAAVGVADVTALNLRDRAPELSSLRAAGWSGRAVVALAGWEGAFLGLVGGAVGGLAALGLGVVFGASQADLALSMAVMLATVTVLALTATAGPALRLVQGPVTRHLREE